MGSGNDVDLAPSWSPAPTNPHLKAGNPGTWNLIAPGNDFPRDTGRLLHIDGGA
jgi:hypothetical protein